MMMMESKSEAMAGNALSGQKQNMIACLKAGAYVDFQSSFRTFRAAQSTRSLELLNCEYCTGPCARVPRVSRVC